MKVTPTQRLMVRRYRRLCSPCGRGWLRCQLRAKRWLWHWRLVGGWRLKRGFDIAASSLFLAMGSPFFLLVAVLVKLEDGGPVIFRQRRVGQYGREFTLLKFRSMHRDAEQRLAEVQARNRHRAGVTFKLADDPRITRVGKWLRKFSFDELPQFVNVLVGDMSLVGPRPPLPREVAQYSLADRRRLEVPQGITCLWQISGRSNLDFAEQVELDVDYIQRRSIWLDLRIVLKTIPAVLTSKGAY